MSESFDFDAPERFVAGAVGPPGGRVFYLQASQNGAVVSFRLEKQQVAALCEYLSGILADLPPVDDEAPPALALAEPVVAEWVVGTLAVAYEEADDRILLVAEELIVLDPDADDATIEEAADDAAIARFRLSRAQVTALVAHASKVVAAGRPFCPVCGRPMDPAGHLCPRNN